MFNGIITSMRPQQWYKNLILFASIIFSLNILNVEMWFTVIFAFIIFCMLSGSEYIINDIIDIESDRKHPVKCKRPLASGKLKRTYTLVFAAMLIIGAVTGSYLINIPFLIISISYLLLILFYSLYLKHLIIVDLLVISIGFVMRAIAGGIAINVRISPWLIVCTFLLALFLALGKRRHELNLLGNNAGNHRKNLAEYSNEMLDQMISITTGALIISYSLYTFFVENYFMMLTIPVIIYGLFRYLFLIHSKNYGGEPEMLFKDKGMLLCMILWGILAVGVLYIPKVINEFLGGF
ncbi:decaprenyl-phosphate phosphoribosyltransferase [Methanosarcinales archaeon]|nr:decaprenyl-phosphate phosphoribosyltransferase [Methanosarcinales archaeon]